MEIACRGSNMSLLHVDLHAITEGIVSLQISSAIDTQIEFIFDSWNIEILIRRVFLISVD